MLATKPAMQLVKSDKDTHFTGAIAQNGQEDENLTGLRSNAGAIKGVQVISKENLAWSVLFFASDGFDDTDADLAKYLGRVDFDTTDALQIASGLYYYSQEAELCIPYRDDDCSYSLAAQAVSSPPRPELHVSLRNRSAASKTAGANGAVSVQVMFDPYGQDA